MSIYKRILRFFYALFILFLILFIVSAGIVYKQLSSGVQYTFDGALNNEEISKNYFVTVYEPSFYLGLEKNGKISLNIETSSGKFYYQKDSLAINILSIDKANIQSEISIRDVFYLASKLARDEKIDKRIVDEVYIDIKRPIANLQSIEYINDSFLEDINIKREDSPLGNLARKYLPKILIRTSNDSNGSVVDGTCTYYVGSVVDCPIVFEFTGNAYFNPSNKFSLDSFRLHLVSERDFNASYIGALFDDVHSMGYTKDNEIRKDIIKSRYNRREAELEDDTEKIKILNKELEDIKIKLKESSSLNLIYEKQKGDDLPSLNGFIDIKNSKMHLKTFPADLKPEPIRDFSLQLQIKDNIGSINLDGLIADPKVRLKFQKELNLQITGNINFSKILEPGLDLYVNASDIYFALLNNTNLNGIADLFVTIKGQNVLDLNGKVDIKKSNGFLTPLKDSTFDLKHNLTKEKNG